LPIFLPGWSESQSLCLSVSLSCSLEM
jgi:hypothetical protein